MKLNSSFWKMSSPKDLDGLYSLLKDCFVFFFFTILAIRIDEENVIKRGCPPSFPKTPLNTHVFTSVFICAVRLIVMANFSSVMAQSIPSMPILLPLSGICWAFVFFFGLKSSKWPTLGPGGSYKNPTAGLKKVCKCPTPGRHQNCLFQ